MQVLVTRSAFAAFYKRYRCTVLACYKNEIHRHIGGRYWTLQYKFTIGTQVRMRKSICIHGYYCNIVTVGVLQTTVYNWTLPRV